MQAGHPRVVRGGTFVLSSLPFLGFPEFSTVSIHYFTITYKKKPIWKGACGKLATDVPALAATEGSLLHFCDSRRPSPQGTPWAILDHPCKWY